MRSVEHSTVMDVCPSREIKVTDWVMMMAVLASFIELLSVPMADSYINTAPPVPFWGITPNFLAVFFAMSSFIRRQRTFTTAPERVRSFHQNGHRKRFSPERSIRFKLEMLQLFML